MKKISGVLLLMIIAGCSDGGKEIANPEKEVSPKTGVVAETSDNSEIEKLPMVRTINGIEIDFTSTTTDGYEVNLDEVYHEDNKNNGNQPLRESTWFNPVTKVEIGDVVETEAGIFTTYEGYKIVDDIDGSGRKGIMFIHSRTNKTDKTITFGYDGVYTATSFFAFHDDIILESHDKTKERAESLGDTHLLSRMVNYKIDGVVECNDSSPSIAPGETSVCYNMVNYIGPGEYRGYSTMYEPNDEGGVRKRGSRSMTINVD